MSQLNGKHVDRAAVEKQALAGVVKQMVGDVERRLVGSSHEQAKQLERTIQALKDYLSERVEAVRREASVPVQKNLIDTEPIARAVERIGAEIGAGALERSKHLSLVKDLVEAVNNLPVPTVSTPVTVDLEPLAVLVNLLRQDAQETRAMVIQLAEAISGVADAVARSAKESTEARAVNRQLVELLKRERPKRAMRIAFSGDEAVVSEE